MPPGLADLIERCMQVDPTRRFQNAQALKTAAAPVLNVPSSAVVSRRAEELKTERAGAPGPARPLFATLCRPSSVPRLG